METPKEVRLTTEPESIWFWIKDYDILIHQVFWRLEVNQQANCLVNHLSSET